MGEYVNGKLAWRGPDPTLNRLIDIVISDPDLFSDVVIPKSALATTDESRKRLDAMDDDSDDDVFYDTEDDPEDDADEDNDSTS